MTFYKSIRVPLLVTVVLCIICSTNASSTKSPITGEGTTTSHTTPTSGRATTHEPTATTGSGNVTTTQPVTVKPPPTQVGNWTIKGPDGKICMRMSFSAQMNVSYVKNDKSQGKVVVNVMQRSADVTSECDSPNRMLNIYPFSIVDKGWTITLTFERGSGGFTLTGVGMSWVYDRRFVDSSESGFSSESLETDNFLDQTVPLGKSYTCSEPLTVNTGQATLTLGDMQLQPFAEEADGNFGDAEPCKVGLSLMMIIIIAAAGGALIAVIIIVIVVVVVVRRRRKRNSAPYSNF